MKESDEARSPSLSTNPQVSVVMATYNAMPYLPLAVESILNQTLKEFRFIIVNDGSTDESAGYLASLNDDRIEVVFQENSGQQAAANLGISLCQTEYIARMDADDLAAPTRLEKQAALLNARPEVGMVGSQVHYLGKKNQGIVSSLPCQHEKIYEELIHNRHAMCNSSTMFRTQLFRDLGGYWEYDISEDWDLFLRIGEQSRLANLDEPLLSMRFHVGSINGRRMAESQLHNEYACELARRRNSGLEKISYEQFFDSCRYRRWPRSMFFKMDCYSVAHYRRAVAEILDGSKLIGYSRLAFSMLCSPGRTLHRLRRMLLHRRQKPDDSLDVDASS